MAVNFDQRLTANETNPSEWLIAGIRGFTAPKRSFLFSARLERWAQDNAIEGVENCSYFG
jgi:hypothetical protein